VVIDFIRESPYTTLKLLTLRLTMLMALVTGHRAQTLHLLKLSDMKVEKDCVTFVLSSPLKTDEPGVCVEFLRFNDPELCVVNLLHEYFANTEDLRQDDQLLLSFIKPFRAVTCDTVRRWILTVMAQAGIDTSLFKAHSTRGASTSAALRESMSL
jgi:hypothetical protein